MRYSTYLIGLLFVFLVFTAFVGTTLYVSDEDKYNVTLGETFTQSYANLSTLQGFVDNTTGVALNMTDASQSAKYVAGDYDSTEKTQINPIRLVYEAFPMTKNLLYSVASFLKIPPIVISVIIGALVIGLLFGLIRLIFKMSS